MHEHIMSRLKANEFGVAQSSQNRRRAMSNGNELNEKEGWKKRRGRGRGRYISKQKEKEKKKKPTTARNNRRRIP